MGDREDVDACRAPGKGGMPVAVWEKLNPRERLETIGAGLIILSFLVAIVAYGVGSNSLALIGAIAVGAILYLKYAPNQNINWPAPTTLIIIAIAGIVGIVVLLDLLTSLRYIGLVGGSALLALLLEVVGAALMLWGAWQEYQIEKPAMPNFGAGMGSSTTSTPPPPASAAPPSTAPPPPPPAAPPMADDDQSPPA